MMELKRLGLKGTYKVRFDDAWFEVYDDKGKAIYFENSNRDWIKREYDEKGNLVYYENSYGYWTEQEYNSKNKVIYYGDSEGYWFEKGYDEEGNEVYFEDSCGYIVDNRTKELTVKEIESLLGYRIKIKRGE